MEQALKLFANENLAVKVTLTLLASTVFDEASLEALAAEWDHLVTESDQRVYFLCSFWNRECWRVVKPGRSRLMIIVCRDEQGRLAGLAPLCVRQRRTAGIPHVREVMFLGTGIYAQTSEYLDVIARRGYEKAVAEAVAEHLKKSKEGDRLHLKEVPAGSRVMPHLMEAMGEGVEVSECNRSHHIDTTTDWDTFISQSARTIRRNVLRLTRRIVAQDGFRFRRIEREEELEGAMDALVRLHQARWRSKGEPGAFAIPGIEELLRGAAREGFREGKLRLWTMELNGEIAAVRLAFFDNGVVHEFQGGFDPAYARQGLGSVMLG